MKAIQVTRHAHPSDLEVSMDVTDPIARPGQVIVDVYAAGLNFFDILMAQGKYQTQPSLPFILGAEFAGRISTHSPIPPGCNLKPGDRVFGFGQGSYAERLAVNSTQVLPAPSSISLEQAAGIYLTLPTSYEALVGRAKAQKGEWVLVLAAAGGVGLAACQIAKLLGCKVIAAAGSDSKRSIASSLGHADAVVDYNIDGWQRQVMKITGGHGVDIVFDPVGLLVPSLKCVAWNARLVVVGFAAGNIEKVPANLLLLKNVSLVGLFWGATAQKDPERYAHVLAVVLDHVARGDLVPHVYEPVYDGLEQVSRALNDLESRKTWGKAVVRVRDEARAKI